MKIKYFVITAVLVTAVLCFGGGVKAQTTAEIDTLIAQLQAQIQSLMQQISDLKAKQGVSTTWCHTFNNYLVAGNHDNSVLTPGEVSSLQTALIKENLLTSGDAVSDSGPTTGLPSVFGDNTAAAVVAFQGKYGIRQTGTVGPITRAKLNALYGCAVTPKPACSNLYWFDNSSSNSCQTQKQFCGAFMYYGLQTFQNQQDCLNAYNKTKTTCTPNWKCGWGPCVNGYQGQYPIDSNNCGTSSSQTATIACPALARQCESRNLSPTISGVSGPTTLDINQTGTWTISASDPENGTLSYSVIWGDETNSPTASAVSNSAPAYTQTTTFTHSYSTSGNYTPIFYVRDTSGNMAKTTISVNVGNSTKPSITVTSPNGGEIWKVGETHNITWNSGLAYVGGCHNFIALQNTSGQTVGIISNGSLTQGQTSLSWNTKDMYSLSCGTGAQSLTVTPGTYRIAVIEQGDGSTSMPDINAYSNYFTITTTTTQPSITVTSPNGGETWTQGQTYNITWASTGLSNSDIVNIMLQEYNSNGVMILGKLLTGTVDNRGSTTLGGGSYSWTIPSTTDSGNRFKIQVSDNSQFINNVAVLGISNNYFSIVAPTTNQCTTDSDCPQLGVACSQTYCPTNKCVSGKCTIVNTAKPSITVVWPNGGEQWKIGTTYAIQWKTIGFSTTDKIHVSLISTPDSTGSSSELPLTETSNYFNSYSWQIPTTLQSAGNTYKIRVYAGSSDPVIFDDSDNYFSIVAP